MPPLGEIQVNIAISLGSICWVILFSFYVNAKDKFSKYFKEKEKELIQDIREICGKTAFPSYDVLKELEGWFNKKFIPYQKQISRFNETWKLLFFVGLGFFYYAIDRVFLNLLSDNVANGLFGFLLIFFGLAIYNTYEIMRIYMKIK